MESRNFRTQQYAAGCLFLSYFEDEIYCLLGKDHYNTFSDFGGKAETIDNFNPLLTACREAYEETLGILSKSELFALLQQSQSINSKSYTNKPYYMYIVWIQYNPLYCNNFNTTLNYINLIPNYNQSFKEKKSIMSVNLSSILKCILSTL